MNTDFADLNGLHGLHGLGRLWYYFSFAYSALTFTLKHFFPIINC